MLSKNAKNSATCKSIDAQLTNTIVAEFDIIDLYNARIQQ